MRSRSALVVGLGLVFACSSEPTDSLPGSGGALDAATGGASSLPPDGGRAGGAGSEHARPPGGGGSGLTPGPCSLKAPTECPGPELRYETVEPIFRERCVVCHFGMPGGPWPLNTYGHVASWRDSIRAALLGCAMPPVDSGMSIPPEDSLLVLEWIRCGMPP